MKNYVKLTQLSTILVIVVLSKTSYGARNSKLERCYKNITSESLITQTESYLQIENQRCEKERYCLDIELPYKTTTIPDYLPEDVRLRTQEELYRFLQAWQGLRYLPKCWQDLQVTLCSMFMPQCNENSETFRINRISKPSADSCYDLKNNNHCKFIGRHYNWSSFSIFNCGDTKLFSSNCTNELRDERIHSSVASCQYPLVVSNDTNTWFEDISGCALHCKYPVLESRDQANLSLFIRTLCSVGLFSTIFATLLLLANRTNAKTSSIDRVITKCTICHAFCYLGWSIQTILGTDIACNQSGSSLYGLPLVANACVLSFFLTYLPSLAYLVWCSCLSKLCQEKLSGSDSRETERIFNLLGCGLPVLALVAVAFVGQIDGHGIYGICTIGQQSALAKMIFIFTPNLIGTGYSTFYFSLTIFKVMMVEKSKPALRREFYRITSMAFFSTMQVIFSFCNFVYQLENRDRWYQSIDDHMMCSLQPPKTLSDLDNKREECGMNINPLVSLYYLELFSTLSIGIIVSSWAYTDQNFRSLRKYLIALLEDDRSRQSENYSPNFDTNGLGHGYSPANGRNSRTSSIDNFNESNQYSAVRLSKHGSLRSVSLSSWIVQPLEDRLRDKKKCLDLVKAHIVSKEASNPLAFAPQLPVTDQSVIDDVMENLPPEDQLKDKDKCLQWLVDHLKLQEALISLARQPRWRAHQLDELENSPDELKAFLTYLTEANFRKDQEWMEAREILAFFVVKLHYFWQTQREKVDQEKVAL